MAAALIPLLGLEPLDQAPIQSLPSEADIIRLIWGHVGSNFKGFRGMTSICCNVEDRRGICLLGNDPGLLVVPGGVAGQFQDLGGQVLQDGGQVVGLLTAV